MCVEFRFSDDGIEAVPCHDCVCHLDFDPDERKPTMLASAWSRLITRAVLAGAAVFVTTLQGSDDPLGKATLSAAITAAVFAAIEILTPVNRQVGVGS